jgi:RHS repeat-associated protein
LNFQDQPIWRQQYAPGQRGLDDAPLVRIEKDLQGSPTTKTYALIRDEMGSVIAVAEEPGVGGGLPPPASGLPPLLARYLYAPYGQRHTELGPELVKIEFDPSITKVGTQNQAATPGQALPGTLRIVSTAPLAPASLTSGLRIEQYDSATGSWSTMPAAELAIGRDDADPTTIFVMRLAGWAKSTRYQITLLPTLTDTFGRTLTMPAGDEQGLVVTLDVPSDGVTSPAYARIFQLNYQQSGSDTLGGAFPGGQTSGFQGAWSDPTTGLGYHRARWMDRRNASWLSEDPFDGIDSENLYSFVAWQASALTDPSGRYDEDVHHYLTAFLASAAGFDRATADEIGRRTQAVDMDERGSLPAEGVDLERNLQQYHFPALARLNELWRGANLGSALTNASTLMAMGEYFHALEDSYSHQAGTARREFPLQYHQHLGLKDYGHWREGHRPDWTWRRPLLAMAMARDVFGKLVRLRERYHQASKPLPFDDPDLQSRLSRFIAFEPELFEDVMYSVTILDVADYSEKVRLLDPTFVIDPGEKALREPRYKAACERQRRREQERLRRMENMR